MFSSNTSAVSGDATYIEDVFSTYLYTGNGSTQTITNGIDLAGKGGMVWLKSRSNAYAGVLSDTARGVKYGVVPSSTAAQPSITGGNVDIYAYNNNGFSVGADNNFNVNTNTATFASWTFRKQPKFFDVVTYTGNGSAQTISHNLASTPGCIIIKATNDTSQWNVTHRSVTGYGLLNATNAWTTPAAVTASTDTTFSVISGWSDPGITYVAYLFAHNAGGFGLTGTDNVISCGSWTGSTTVNLGYEPQFVMVKPSSTTGNWQILDNVREWVGTDAASSSALGGKYLAPNLSSAEATTAYNTNITPTGFKVDGASGDWIYVAIRRGPMKVPTDGTKVFIPVARTGTGAAATVTTNFPPDCIVSSYRGGGLSTGVWDRLRGVTQYLETTGTQAEATGSNSITLLPNTAYVLGSDSATDRINRSAYTYANWVFGRAPSFFDVVCDTGTGAAHTISHNLGVAPELIIRKRRSSLAENWLVLPTVMGLSELRLNQTNAISMSGGSWNNTLPTASVFSVGSGSDVNGSGYTYVTYLFATCPGVSKVGSYTGTGALLNIDCGFAGGARFVMIKRTDSADNWYVWDTARGMVAGTDPNLYMNVTSAESNANSVYTNTGGFQILASPARNINGAGNTYIYLAIA